MFIISPRLSPDSISYNYNYLPKFDKHLDEDMLVTINIARVLCDDISGCFRIKTLVNRCGIPQQRISHFMPLFVAAGVVDVFRVNVQQRHYLVCLKSSPPVARNIVYSNRCFGGDIGEVVEKVKCAAKKYRS